jgi:hypothetical protein
VTGENAERRLRVAAAADDALAERALLQSILQYIRVRVQLSRDLVYEMERCRPVCADRRAAPPGGRAAGSQAPSR